MTRKELLKKLCTAEGGKRQALDAGQCREVLAKLRCIIGEETGVDLDEIIAMKCVTIDLAGLSAKAEYFEAFQTHAWRNGKPVK